MRLTIVFLAALAAFGQTAAVPAPAVGTHRFCDVTQTADGAAHYECTDMDPGLTPALEAFAAAGAPLSSSPGRGGLPTVASGSPVTPLQALVKQALAGASQWIVALGNARTAESRAALAKAIGAAK